MELTFIPTPQPILFIILFHVLLRAMMGTLKKNFNFVNLLMLLPKFLNFANAKSLDFTKINGS